MFPDPAQDILQKLSKSFASRHREEFFQHLTCSLATLLKVDHVVIARIDSHQSFVTPLAFYSNGQWREQAPYPIKETPAAQLDTQAELFVDGGARERFPHDSQLAALSVEGYLGVPMRDADTRRLGFIALMHSATLTLPCFALDLLRIVAWLAGAELSRQLIGASANTHIARQRRALRLLSESGEAVVNAQDEIAMMQSCCDVAVETGGYAAAWISRPGEPGQADSLKVKAMSDRDGEEIAWCSPRQLMIKRYSRMLARAAFEQGEPVILGQKQDARGVSASLKQTLLMLGVKTFIALPLMFRGQPLGVLSCYHAQEEGISEREREVLGDLANDIAFGLDSLVRRQTERRIQHAVIQVATAVSADHGEAFLSQLTAHMADALAAEVGFIALLDEQEPDVASMLSLHVRGERQAGLRYRLASVPCEKVIIERECVVLEGAHIQMPAEAEGALDWVSGYIGRRLDDAQGNPIGVIGVMFEKPLTQTRIARAVLQIFAARVGAELWRQQDEARIRELAYRDECTRLPNRAALMRHLTRHVDATPSTPLALLLLGLNHFKEVNDTAGHYVGDRVLQEVARRFGEVLSEEHYLARLGGDEFVVLACGMGQEAALALAARLQASLVPPIVIEQHSAEMSAGVGVSLYPGQASTAPRLLRYADIAMYQTKRQPLSVSLFEPWMEQRLREKLHMAKRLGSAIAEKRLELHYQPQVDLRTGALIGAEALARWHDDELGHVSPGEFIPLAEERGMMVALGRCVIEKACRQLAAWHAQGLELTGQLAINVAADQFDDNDLIEALFENCTAYAIPPSALSLELTESGVMVNPEQAVATTRHCKKQGIGLAIDDFGTGYSSLAYLKRFAVDKIKIDISFIRDMLTSENDRVIVATIIAMAHTLGLTTIAEGIERAEQIDPLIAMGCTQGQGYLFDRPLTADQFARRWLEAPASAR